MGFKQIYVKIVKTAFEKTGCHGNGRHWYGFNQHIVFLDKFYEKSPNFVAVAVFVVKILIFEFSTSTLCLPMQGWG